jgi:hypothetical protein
MTTDALDEKATSIMASDPFLLKVKPQYILAERASSLPPVMDTRDHQEEYNSGEAQESGKRSRKRRGQNKKRPRDVRQDASEKVCMAILRGDVCPFDEGKCRFSHDLKGFMVNRPPDIAEVEGGCPIYNKHGFCMFGAMCRLGSNHITKSGENLRKEQALTELAKKVSNPDADQKENPPRLAENDMVNILPRDVQFQLRKNKYCKWIVLVVNSIFGFLCLPQYRLPNFSLCMQATL